MHLFYNIVFCLLLQSKAYDFYDEFYIDRGNLVIIIIRQGIVLNCHELTGKVGNRLASPLIRSDNCYPFISFLGIGIR